MRGTLMAIAASLICFAGALSGEVGTGSVQPDALVNHPEIGLQLAAGFEIQVFADRQLADDIQAITFSPDGQLVTTGRGYIKKLIDTDHDGRADQAKWFAETQTGGMGLCFDGPEMLFVGDGGLWRYRDNNGDSVADGDPELLAVLNGGEHGAHAVRLGPGGRWYVMGGNDAGIEKLNPASAQRFVAQPQAGALLRLARDGELDQVIAHGFRNAYDFDFNGAGDLFTCDSDVERDFFLPWYTPTRLYHIAVGGHHGWRLPGYARSWNRSGLDADTVDYFWPFGRGSPTGVECYRHYLFPAKYWGGLFVLDWTFGTVFFVPWDAALESFQLPPERFLEPMSTHGFAPTDVAVGPEGALYISVGGRGTRGQVYRITPQGTTFEQDDEQRQPLSWDLSQVLRAPQPLAAWSRARWRSAARVVGRDAVRNAIVDPSLPVADRVRAIEIVTEMFGGLPFDLAQKAAGDPSPQIRARVCWSLGCRPRGEVVDLLFELALDSETHVRRFALEALTEQAHRLESATYIAALVGSNFNHLDKRVRLAAANLARQLPESIWQYILRQRLQTQGELTRAMVFIWRNPETMIHVAAADSILDSVSHTSDIGLHRQVVRLLILALGDQQLDQPLAEAYAGYELQASLQGHEALRTRIQDWVNRVFPSKNADLNRELARLLGMIESEIPNHAERVLRLIDEASSPIWDFHFLVTLSRLTGQRSPEMTQSTALAIISMEAKLNGREMRPKLDWWLRWGEVLDELVNKDSGLIDALLAQSEYLSSPLLELISSLTPERRDQVSRLLLTAVRERPEYLWTPSTVELLADLPTEETHGLLRNQWARQELRGPITRLLANSPTSVDIPRFLAGLRSSDISVVTASLTALLNLPPDPSLRALTDLYRLGIRLQQTENSQAVQALWLKTWSWVAGEINLAAAQVKIDPMQTAFEWYRQTNADIVAEEAMIRQGGSAGWEDQLAGLDWSRGSAARGEILFHERACHDCHTGPSALGPSLAGVTQRFTPMDLLRHIQYPDLAVAPAFRGSAIYLANGDVQLGFIAFHSADGVLVRTGPGDTVRLSEDDIERIVPSPVSMMPSALLLGLDPGALVDFHAYLQTLSPPPDLRRRQ